MGNVEGLYGKDDFHLAKSVLKGFHFLAVEEIHKLGVRTFRLILYRTISMME
jgi:hypothetical protein